MSEHKAREAKIRIGFKDSVFEFFRSDSRSLLIPFLAITLVILLVYGNVLGNGFVWDDIDSIKESPILHSFQYIPKIFSESMNLIYRPLVYSTYIFLYEIFGGHPFFFHAFNMGIHIAVSFLVFVLFRKFFNPRIALLITVLFSVHPVNVEAVTWVSAYSELSYVLFGLLSLLFAIRFGENKNTKFSLILASIFTFLGFLSKESTIIFSAFSVLYLLIFARKKILWGIIALGIPAAAYFYIRFFVIEGVFYSQYEKFIVPIQNVPLFERILHIPSILCFYIKTFFVPINLHIEQYWVHEDFGFGNFFLPLGLVGVFVGGLVFAGITLRKSAPELQKAFFLFTGGLVLWSFMHIQILPLTMTVAERWMYGLVIFMLGILGAVLSAICKKTYFKAVIIVLLIVVLVFAARTVIRNRDWKNNMTLYSHDYKINPNYAMENNYGSELFNSGKHEEAFVHIEKSVQLKPDWWRNWTNRGVYFEKKGEIEEAMRSYQVSIQNNPGYIIPYFRLASIHLFSQDLDTAEKYVKEGLSYSPNNPDLLKTYAFILYAGQKQKEAQNVMNALYMLDPTPANKNLFDAISRGHSIQINKQN